ARRAAHRLRPDRRALDRRARLREHAAAHRRARVDLPFELGDVLVLDLDGRVLLFGLKARALGSDLVLAREHAVDVERAVGLAFAFEPARRDRLMEVQRRLLARRPLVAGLDDAARDLVRGIQLHDHAGDVLAQANARRALGVAVAARRARD